MWAGGLSSPIPPGQSLFINVSLPQDAVRQGRQEFGILLGFRSSTVVVERVRPTTMPENV
ncbi:hypothetical protein Pst134EA_000442 [Puccinia striiformis f. sp. tritici]|uniref:hypothetical protein n=1 Tax=Puccinia striiformis f. sp. tritici TaxID=168172 RepID=UPI0020084B34|nr:hypothetical protein Pst134EA_000442 [Puccinia striiformis f. sp. tritici]KAH9473369.1 hypothetical protein Pst134EA_000442 [Puccinia striiformis f. sp. tritici]